MSSLRLLNRPSRTVACACTCRRPLSSSSSRQRSVGPILNELWTSSSLFLPVTADPLTQTVLARPSDAQQPQPEPELGHAATSERLLPLIRRGHSAGRLQYAKFFFDYSKAASFDAPTRPQLLYSANSFYGHGPNETVPEILVLGCSNAGKSTLINAVLDCKLARASDTPGYTKLVHAYSCGPPTRLAPEQVEHMGRLPPQVRRGQLDALKHSLILLDTPGYGHKSIADWGNHIEKIVSKRRQLKGIVILLRGDLPEQVPTSQDIKVLELLANSKHRIQVVATRADRRGEDWPWAAWTIARKVGEVLGHRGDWGTDRRGRGLWDGGVWVTAAGADRSAFPPMMDKDNAGIRGLRAALLDMAGIAKGSSHADGAADTLQTPSSPKKALEAAPVDEAEEEDASWEEEEIVPFDQIPVKPRPAPNKSNTKKRRYR